MELAPLKEVWAKVPSQRRQSLLEDLEELADADTLVSFEEIGRLALTDEAAKVRALAIRLLWDVQERKLAPTYLQMLENDPDVEVRATAATALGTYVYLGEIDLVLIQTLRAQFFRDEFEGLPDDSATLLGGIPHRPGPFEQILHLLRRCGRKRSIGDGYWLAHVAPCAA